MKNYNMMQIQGKPLAPVSHLTARNHLLIMKIKAGLAGRAPDRYDIGRK
jgi:hypothetical protein